MNADDFTDPSPFAGFDPLRLAGSRCARCDALTFPAAASCPRCSARDTVTEALPPTGTLWTWTIQHKEPKPPYVPPDSGFEPFGVGYIDLGSVLVESRLAGPAKQWRIGEPMELTTQPAWTVDGNTRYTFAFQPTSGEDSI